MTSTPSLHMFFVPLSVPHEHAVTKPRTARNSSSLSNISVTHADLHPTCGSRSEFLEKRKRTLNTSSQDVLWLCSQFSEGVHVFLRRVPLCRFQGVGVGWMFWLLLPSLNKEPALEDGSWSIRVGGPHHMQEIVFWRRVVRSPPLAPNWIFHDSLPRCFADNDEKLLDYVWSQSLERSCSCPNQHLSGASWWSGGNALSALACRLLCDAANSGCLGAAPSERLTVGAVSQLILFC